MDDVILINLLAELADREDELTDLRALRGVRSKRLKVIALGRQILDDAVDEAETWAGDEAARSRGRRGRIRDTEALLARKRDQVIGVTDRKQYQALQREIAGLEKELDRLETAELEYMDEADAAAVRELPAMATTDHEAEEADLRATEEKAVLAEAEILGEIDRLIDMTPTAVSRHLGRLRKQGGRAVVRVEGRACGGCGGQMPAQQAIDAARGKTLVRCPSCACFVVRESYT